MKKFSKIALIAVVSLLVLASVLAWAGCKKSTSLTGVRFDNGVLSFDKDSIVGAAADQYTAFVNGVEKRMNLSENGTKLTVDLSKEMESKKDIEVEVEAKGDKVKIEETIIVRHLPELSVSVVNGVFDWTESAAQYASLGGMIYDIILDGKRISSTTETTYKASTGVTHTIVVRPRVAADNAFYYSDWSQETQATVLSTPSAVTVRWGEGHRSAIISWAGHSLSSASVTFQGTINGIPFEGITASQLDTSTIEGLDVSNGFTIQLQAKSGTAAISDSAMSKPYSFIQLDAVQNISVVDGNVTFSPVENAARYLVSVNGEVTPVEGTSYKLPVGGESYSINVCAVPADGYYYDQNWNGKAVSFNVLNPLRIYYDSQSFFIEGAGTLVESFIIRVQYESKDENGDAQLETVYTQVQPEGNRIFGMSSYSFAKAGRYLVSVKSIAKKGTGYMDSTFSDPYEVIRLDVIPGLSVEEVLYGSTGDSYLQIIVDDVKEYAEWVTRYQLLVDGIEVSSTGHLTFKVPKPNTVSENTYEFSIKTISDNDGDDTRVVLSSYKEVSFKALKFAQPNNVRLNENGSVEWDMPKPVSSLLQNPQNANEYNDLLADYQVVMLQSYTASTDSSANNPYSTVELGENASHTGGTFTFPSTLAPGTVDVRVFARSQMSVQNAAHPGKIKLVFDEGANGKYVASYLSSDVAGASGIVAKRVNNENVEDGLPIIVLSSDYSAAETLVQLAAPEDFFIEDGTLYWAAVMDATGYEVKFATEDAQGNPVNGTIAKVSTCSFTFDWENILNSYQPQNGITEEKLKALLGSTSGCVINVVACGNRGNIETGEVYSYDSVNSKDVRIFKLPTSTKVSVTDSNIVWNSVDYCSGYRVYINGNAVATTQNPLYNIEAFGSGLYRVQIQALGDDEKYFTSDRTEVFRFYKLPEMQVSRRNGAYVWPAIANALTYELQLGGTMGTLMVDTRSVDVETFEENGVTYYSKMPNFANATEERIIISARAKANNGQPIEGSTYPYPVIASNVVSFEQRIVKENDPILDSPKCDYTATFQTVTIEANVVGEAPAGCRYKYAIDSVSRISDSKTLVYRDLENDAENLSTGSHTVKIAYSANFFDEEGVYHQDSEFITVGSFNLLRGTTEVRVNGAILEGSPTRVEWTGITGAQKYKYYYDVYVCDYDDLTGEATPRELVYASPAAYTESNENYFDFTLKTVLTTAGVAYDSEAVYTVQAYVITMGDKNAGNLPSYEVAFSTLTEAPQIK